MNAVFFELPNFETL